MRWMPGSNRCRFQLANRQYLTPPDLERMQNLMRSENVRDQALAVDVHAFVRVWIDTKASICLKVYGYVLVCGNYSSRLQMRTSTGSHYIIPFMHPTAASSASLGCHWMSKLCRGTGILPAPRVQWTLMLRGIVRKGHWLPWQFLSHHTAIFMTQHTLVRFPKQHAMHRLFGKSPLVGCCGRFGTFRWSPFHLFPSEILQQLTPTFGFSCFQSCRTLCQPPVAAPHTSTCAEGGHRTLRKRWLYRYFQGGWALTLGVLSCTRSNTCDTCSEIISF